jgi:hypothetical protein
MFNPNKTRLYRPKNHLALRYVPLSMRFVNSTLRLTLRKEAHIYLCCCVFGFNPLPHPYLLQAICTPSLSKLGLSSLCATSLYTSTSS